MKVTQKPGVSFRHGMPLSIPNEVRQNCDEFYISYNASPAHYGSDTTAIVVLDPSMTKFYILLGDHRKQLEEASTLDKCMEYYKANPDKQSEYSDSL